MSHSLDIGSSRCEQRGTFAPTRLRLWLALCVALLGSGCASYQYAKNVKLISFDGDVAAGRGTGPVRGESCQTRLFGYPINEAPTLDAAVADAREQHHLRYMNNVSTDTSGFNALFYAQSCLVVKGTGFQ